MLFASMESVGLLVFIPSWYVCTSSDFMFDCCVVGYTSLISSFGYHILPKSGKFIVACFSDGVTYHCVDLVSHTFWNCFYGVDAP